MSVRPAIYFDTLPRVDQVTLAVVPIDGVTGAIVRGGVKAKIKGLPDRPIVNGSGMLVFINLPAPPVPPAYEVEIDASEAGFVGPETLSFEPPAANDPDIETKRRLPLLLKPRSDYPFPTGITLVRGVVVRGADPVAGALISAQPPLSSDPFEALSGARGAFALALRPHPEGPDPLQLAIRFEEGADVRILPGKVIAPGRSHSFRKPIDLTGNNDPDFFTI
jgi:hypothetical protein